MNTDITRVTEDEFTEFGKRIKKRVGMWKLDMFLLVLDTIQMLGLLIVVSMAMGGLPATILDKIFWAMYFNADVWGIATYDNYIEGVTIKPSSVRAVQMPRGTALAHPAGGRRRWATRTRASCGRGSPSRPRSSHSISCWSA